MLDNSEKLAIEVEYLKSLFENELSALAKQQQSIIETIHKRRLQLDVALDGFDRSKVSGNLRSAASTGKLKHTWARVGRQGQARAGRGKASVNTDGQAFAGVRRR